METGAGRRGAFTDLALRILWLQSARIVDAVCLIIHRRYALRYRFAAGGAAFRGFAVVFAVVDRVARFARDVKCPAVPAGSKQRNGSGENQQSDGRAHDNGSLQAYAIAESTIMTETEFLTLSAAVLSRIEEAVENAASAADADIDIERKADGVLELEFENGSKVVVNSQAPMRQIWVAAKSGGFHFEVAAGGWRDTRSGEDLFATLSKVVSEQSGIALRLGPVV